MVKRFYINSNGKALIRSIKIKKIKKPKNQKKINENIWNSNNNHMKIKNKKINIKSGLSYNPSKDIHIEAIKEAYDYKIKSKSDDIKVKQSLANILSKISDNNDININNDIDYKNNDNNDTATKISYLNPPTTNDNRITRKKKNKSYRRKAQEYKHKMKLIRKKRNRDMGRIKEILTEIKKEKNIDKKKITNKSNVEEENNIFPEVISSSSLHQPLRKLNVSNSLAFNEIKYSLQKKGFLVRNKRKQKRWI